MAAFRTDAPKMKKAFCRRITFRASPRRFATNRTKTCMQRRKSIRRERRYRVGVHEVKCSPQEIECVQLPKTESFRMRRGSWRGPPVGPLAPDLQSRALPERFRGRIRRSPPRHCRKTANKALGDNRHSRRSRFLNLVVFLRSCRCVSLIVQFME